MRLVILALFVLAIFCADGKYSDLSDSFTDLLLSLSGKGNAFNDFQNKLGNLAVNIDSKDTSNAKVQNSVIDLFSALEAQAS